MRPLTTARKLMPTTCPNNGSSGQFRTAVNPLPTDRTYTGQEQDTTGLMFYHARFYDPALGTFISPDTMVPEAGRVSDYNRFLYTRGNPLRYSDPTGHYTDEEIKQHLMDTYGDSWHQYWDAWLADPYWMWILYKAHDGYILSTGLAGNVTFGNKKGSFTLDHGQLHDYQGQGVYALYNSDVELIQDGSWLGYRTETGSLRTVIRSGMGVYYQPVYDYSNGVPMFSAWRRINVSWSFHLDVGAGDQIPAIASYVVTKFFPKLIPLMPPIALATTVDALVVAKADQVEYTMVESWPPYDANGTDSNGKPAPRPIPNQFLWPNPNGLYPSVPGR